MDVSYFMSFFEQYDIFAIFTVLILCGLGLPLPEDITLITAGLIAYSNNTTSVHIMIIFCLLGVIIGDLIVFMIGYISGAKILNNKFTKKILNEKNHQRVNSFYLKYGTSVIFISRFLPGLRMPIFLFAGIFKKVKISTFIFMDLLAAILSVPALVYVGYFFGGDFKKIKEFALNNTAMIGGLLVLFFLSYLIYKNLLKKHKA